MSAGEWRLGVWSRHLMGGIESEPFRLFCPDFADELVGCEALEGLKPAREIVS